jgi:hypothetical protein
MEDRAEQAEQAKFLKIFGEWPLDLIGQTAPGLQRKDFERELRGYLAEQHFSRTLSNKLVAKLFKMTCFFLRRKKALPRMSEIVNSTDWKKRASLLKRHSSLVAKLIERVLRQSGTSPSDEGGLSRRLRTWTEYQLTTLRDVFSWLYELQRGDALVVRHLSHPPIDSQFLWEVRQYLKEKMGKASVEDIDIVVAGCGVAAHIFSSEEVAQDVVSRIPMRISRTNKTFSKQFSKSEGVTTLTYRPKRRTLIVLPKEIVFYNVNLQQKTSQHRANVP